MFPVSRSQWRIRDLQRTLLLKDEAPHAPMGWVWGVGRGVPFPLGRGLERGNASRQNKSISDLKMTTLGAFWALFITVHLLGLNTKAVLLCSRILRPG